MERSDRIIQVLILTIILAVFFKLLTHAKDCKAQSYYNSTQEINRQQHQQEMMRQQQQILQQQYIQTQQLDQMRRDAEQRFSRERSQSNRSHEQLHLIGR